MRSSELLREKLANKELEGRWVYFVTLPMESVHSHRLIGATRHMNPDIRIKIYEFVADAMHQCQNNQKAFEKTCAATDKFK